MLMINAIVKKFATNVLHASVQLSVELTATAATLLIMVTSMSALRTVLELVLMLVLVATVHTISVPVSN